MTLSVTAPVQSPIPPRNASYPPPPPPVTTQAPAAERGYSDSVLPCQRSIIGDAAPTTDIRASDIMNPVFADLQVPTAPHTGALPNSRKAKRQLRLPSFQAPDLVSPPIPPAALLTPPDDPTRAELHNMQAALAPFHTPSRPVTQALMTPQPSDLTPPPSELPRASSHVRGPILVTDAQGHTSTHSDQSDPDDQASSTNSQSASVYSHPISLAISTAIRNRPEGLVLDVLCHTQPCPLPSEDAPTTAITELLTDLMTRAPHRSSIQITHAVPVKFNMGQVPQSPSVTPNLSQAHEPSDYFSMTNAFSRAVIVNSHQDALRTPQPCSPHPIVAPTTIHISLLERYIPPSSTAEVNDLFSTRAPSALVDRLTELSVDRGSLIFVYPTQTGAHTFNTHYLGPLLHPLLRRISGVHGLMSTLGNAIAKFESIDATPEFDEMHSRLGFLLQTLNSKINDSKTSLNPSSDNGHPIPQRPCFDIAYSTRESIPLNRKSWQDWYLHQERARIQAIVAQYFARGTKLPSEPGMTAGSICREIFSGLENEDFPADGMVQRPGVEVGVFVVQRAMQ